MRKKLLAVLLMVLCIFSVCGCATVNYSEIIFSDGSIAQQIIVVTDNAKLTAAGFNVQDVQADIMLQANSIYQDLYNKYLFADIPELNFFQKQTSHEFKREAKDNTVVIVLKFNSIKDYYYFYNHALPDDNNSSGVVTDHGFYQKDTSVSETVYYDLQNDNIAKYWLDYFKTNMPTVSFADCKYNYTYSTPNEKIYSDADVVEYDEYGNVAHTWSFESADLTGENATTGGMVTLYTVKIKTPLWYFVALGVTAGVIIGLVIYCKIKDNKKKKAVLSTGDTTQVEIK